MVISRFSSHLPLVYQTLFRIVKNSSEVTFVTPDICRKGKGKAEKIFSGPLHQEHGSHAKEAGVSRTHLSPVTAPTNDVRLKNKFTSMCVVSKSSWLT